MNKGFEVMLEAWKKQVCPDRPVQAAYARRPVTLQQAHKFGLPTNLGFVWEENSWKFKAHKSVLNCIKGRIYQRKGYNGKYFARMTLEARGTVDVLLQ